MIKRDIVMKRERDSDEERDSGEKSNEDDTEILMNID